MSIVTPLLSGVSCLCFFSPGLQWWFWFCIPLPVHNPLSVAVAMRIPVAISTIANNCGASINCFVYAFHRASSRVAHLLRFIFGCSVALVFLRLVIVVRGVLAMFDDFCIDLLHIAVIVGTHRLQACVPFLCVLLLRS